MELTLYSINNNTSFDVRAVLAILLIHFISDFIIQTQDQASNKSSSNSYLARHVFNYSLFTAIGWLVIFPSHISMPWDSEHETGTINVFWVFTITFVAHFITDYFTSRWTRSLWEKKEVHDFFVAIGFDQFLHFLQLFYMFAYLSNY